MMVELDDIPVDTLVPEPLAAVSSSDEFMQRLPEFDSDMERQLTEAEASGECLRYVGECISFASGQRSATKVAALLAWFKHLSAACLLLLVLDSFATLWLEKGYVRIRLHNCIAGTPLLTRYGLWLLQELSTARRVRAAWSFAATPRATPSRSCRARTT